jgi:hypothetical protein
MIMNGVQVRIWEEEKVMAYMKIPSQHSPGENGEIYITSQP